MVNRSRISRLDETNEDDVCRIILTSGTTGEAKAVGVTHRMLANRIAKASVLDGKPIVALRSDLLRFWIGYIAGISIPDLFSLAGRHDHPERSGPPKHDTIVRSLQGPGPDRISRVPRGVYEIIRATQRILLSFELAIVGGSQLSPLIVATRASLSLSEYRRRIRRDGNEHGR